MEQDEYTREGINWQNIEFVDNQNVLDIIGMQSLNIMALIDEESKFPKGKWVTIKHRYYMSYRYSLLRKNVRSRMIDIYYRTVYYKYLLYIYIECLKCVSEAMLVVWQCGFFRFYELTVNFRKT